MKKSILLLTITMLMSACGNKAAQAASDANKTDSALADKESIAVADAPSEDEQAFNKFFDQLNFDDFVALLKTPNDDTAKKCGLSPIYSANSEPSEEGDADTSVTVYGWGVEKGKPLDFGYEIISTSAHSCYFYYQQDTSTQAAICFKNKADADRFFEKALAYGLVDVNGSYHIADKKLPNGTVKVESLSDYNIMTQIMKPELDNDYNKGYYVIHFYYFA